MRSDRQGRISSIFHPFRARVLLLAPVLLAAGAVLPHQSVYATLAPCRSDPIVRISDGTVVHLSAAIYDNASDVNQIVYVLHGPSGTTPLAVVFTGGKLAAKEQFTYDADQPAQTFTANVSVDTGAAVPVTVSALASSLPSVGKVSTSGYSGQDLSLNL